MAIEQYIVREIDLHKINTEGIPLDYLGIMDFVNRAIARGIYIYVPRPGPITLDELRNRWLPNAATTITYVAVDKQLNRIIAAGTMFLDLAHRVGEITITKDTDCTIRGVGTSVAREVIRETLSRGLTVHVHSSIDNIPMYEVMERLGYSPVGTVTNYYRGKIVGNNDAYEWIIHPE